MQIYKKLIHIWKKEKKKNTRTTLTTKNILCNKKAIKSPSSLYYFFARLSLALLYSTLLKEQALYKINFNTSYFVNRFTLFTFPRPNVIRYTEMACHRNKTPNALFHSSMWASCFWRVAPIARGWHPPLSLYTLPLRVSRCRVPGGLSKTRKFRRLMTPRILTRKELQ